MMMKTTTMMMPEQQHQQQVFVERCEEGDKEKKKRRRSHRRNKNNNTSPSVGYSSVNGMNGEATEWSGYNGSSSNVTVLTRSLQNCGLDNHASNDQGSSKASNGFFSSLPIMHINEKATELGSMQDQSPSVIKDTLVSKSCPDPISYEKSNGPFQNNINFPNRRTECCTDLERKYFVPHWSVEAVNEAIQKGDAFRATFRVNSYNRLEAYCTIDGVPTDVLISGVAAQNRAVEGDIVAVKLDPFGLWSRMKGSAGHPNNFTPLEDSNISPEVIEVVADNGKGKQILDGGCESGRRFSPPSDPLSNVDYFNEHKDASSSIGKICNMLTSFPTKRPTGTVVAIIERSPRRDGIVGFLGVKQWVCSKATKKNKNSVSSSDQGFIQFYPNDVKFTRMYVPVRSLPDGLKMRLMEGDTTVEMELVAARIGEWSEESLLPQAQIIHIFGPGGEIEPQIAAILFENGICTAKFSPESLSCLPVLPWEIPLEEIERRKDLRNLCTFTIDPSTASDLDDALSVERLSDGMFRVGVHIADVSYFILPNTPLDVEAETRSTSVYIRQRKIPMLPPQLSENLGSLIPGVDRLAFSIIFDCNLAGDVVDRWIGHTVIRSCCKMSYQHAQDMIDGAMDFENSSSDCKWPEVFGEFARKDVLGSVKSLYDISKRLQANRFKDGALRLDNSKVFFFFDERGIPYDSMLHERTDSNSLVEEFMLLANKTAAEVISRAYPDCALLRRHPEPNARRLREFEAFWCKHGLELDTSSSGQLHLSLGKIREKLKNDPVLFDILVSFATKPMQLATYFCTGDFKDRQNEWAHYALAIPLYTHFTSPLRRYPDIVVHRTLSAAVEAENICLQKQKLLPKAHKREIVTRKCFSSLHLNKEIAESKECRDALSAAALNHNVLGTSTLAEVAAYCNKRTIACRHAEDASEKLYLWVLLNNKETLILEARVLGLGPKFMSIYIHKLAMERRIYYDDVEGLSVEWLETTSALVLNLCTSRRPHRRGSRSLEDVALVINPCDLETEQVVIENNANEVETVQQGSCNSVSEILKPIDTGLLDSNKIDPAAFPLTVGIFSTIHVALHPIGGDNGPLDIGARLYMCSYFS